MNKKAIVAVLCGVLAAGLLFIVVGLIVHFTAKSNVVAHIVGLFIIASGIILAAAAILALTVALLVILITKNKNK